MTNSLASPADNLTIIEQGVMAEDRPQTPVLLRNQIDADEWARKMPPLVALELNFDRWTEFEWQIAQKFIASRSTGWWYFDQRNRLAFEKTEDYVMFYMWAKNEPMSGGQRGLAI